MGCPSCGLENPDGLQPYTPAHLAGSLPTARLLLLVDYRPECQHGWGRRTYCTQPRLEPLPPVSADAPLQARA